MSQDLIHLSVFVAKPVVVLLVLTLLFRTLGKRTASQLNIYDVAMVIMLSNAIQNALTEGKGDLSVGLTVSATLILVAMLLTRLIARYGKFERALVGSPIVVISNGRVLRQKLRRQVLTEDELMTVLHSHGLDSPTEVAMAVLETDGSLSIVPK
jgi:uncharacterized membrane protein YcaP (DUF421 family)